MKNFNKNKKIKLFDIIQVDTANTEKIFKEFIQNRNDFGDYYENFAKAKLGFLRKYFPTVKIPRLDSTLLIVVYFDNKHIKFYDILSNRLSEKIKIKILNRIKINKFLTPEEQNNYFSNVFNTQILNNDDILNNENTLHIENIRILRPIFKANFKNILELI